MSAENVALITSLRLDPAEEVTEVVNDEDAALRVREAIGAAFDPSVECTMEFPGEMRVAYARGLDGVREAWKDWLKHWASVHAEVEEVHDGGDQVIVVHRLRGQRRAGGPEETLRRATVWTVRNQRVVHVDFNVIPEQAVAALKEAGQPDASVDPQTAAP